MKSKFPFPFDYSVPLAPLSTFGLGGKADILTTATTKSELLTMLDFLWEKKIPFRVFAGGSNVVFPDEGIKQFLLCIRGGGIEIHGRQLVAASGGRLSAAIESAIEEGLGGLEKLSGIPGTVGGAVVGNAGAYGSAVSDRLKQVTVWVNGKIRILTNKDCKFSYRDSIFKDSNLIILDAVFDLTETDRDKLNDTSEEIIKIRKQKYKPGLKCPGSFFKNVLVTEVSPGLLARLNQSIIISGKIPAGYLLTEVGARGKKVGGIEVSDFHGNLLINNTGKGKSEDVKKIAKILKDMVYKKFGIMLEEEVRYL